MKPELGVCYYPEHWSEDIWADDAKKMRETGISWVRIAEFSWAKIEPSEGVLHWEWLDHAIEVLGNAGLKIVLGTPSATPPKWVCNKYPDMLAVDINGNPRTFGSRRHYCFSHIGYRLHASHIATLMAKRYGTNPYIKAWQIDNEYGCHDTIISYSDVARLGFRQWLTDKYKSIDALNNAWGNVFWSMQYTIFDDIDLPHLTVTEANPTHCLDFKRYSSDQVALFNLAQIKALRAHTDTPLIHNYMGRITEFDHYTIGDKLDIASWDSYPLGFLENVLPEENDAYKLHYCEQGDPDFQAFHHDLYRCVGKGRLWIMEQQAGPVNWASYNPIPLKGMVKLWTMEAIAHGAEVVSYFRWRQLPFAQEQLHSGLLACDNTNTRGQIEVSEIKDELKALGNVEITHLDIAIVFDYESSWAWSTQPQGESFNYFRLVFEQYRALRKLGLSIDILPPDTKDFGDRKLILIPGLMSWNANIQSAIAKFKGLVLVGPRTGLKTKDMHIPSILGPNFADVKTLRVASLRDGKSLELQKGGRIIYWFEELNGGQYTEYTTNSMPILARSSNHLYLGSWLDQEAYMRIFEELLTELNIEVQRMPKGVRKRKLGTKELIVNYNPFEVKIGSLTLSAAGYAWQ